MPSMHLCAQVTRDLFAIAKFLFYTPLHSTLPSEYCHSVWCGKTRMVGLPDGEKTLRM